MQPLSRRSLRSGRQPRREHFRLSARGIAVEAQGELMVKGKTQPIKVYAVRVDSLVAETV
jgi:hypothetical protein